MNPYSWMKDELTKIAISRKVLRRVQASGPEDMERLMAMAAGHGASTTKHLKGMGGSTKERFSEFVRGVPYYRKDIQAASETPDYITRGSPLWRKAMRDVKDGNMVTIEHGAPMGNIKNMEQFGLGGMINKPLHVAQSDWASRARPDQQYLAGKGAFFSAKDTPRTSAYAAQFHDLGPGERGGRLRIDMPRSLADDVMRGGGEQSELQVPKDMYKQWAKNPRVAQLESKPSHYSLSDWSHVEHPGSKFVDSQTVPTPASRAANKAHRAGEEEIDKRVPEYYIKARNAKSDDEFHAALDRVEAIEKKYQRAPWPQAEVVKKAERTKIAMTAPAALQQGVAHTMPSASQPGIQSPKRAMPKANFAPKPPSVGGAKVPSVPKPIKAPKPKLSGMFGKAMRGVSRLR